MSNVVEVLERLGIVLPKPMPVKGAYRKVTVHGGTAYVAGTLATASDPPRVLHPGAVGSDLTLEEGRESARAALLGVLASLAEELGDLDRVERFLHIGGFVRAAPGFTKVNHVIGGASDLIGEVFGADGFAARTAVGVSELPDDASVVLDAVVALRS